MNKIIIIYRFAKLATLLIKTVAKPVSKRIKRDFSKNKTSRRLVIWIGQASHSVTSRMTIWSEGYKVRSITPLEEDKALSVGSDFVGESFILLVSSGLVIWEYNRSTTKTKEKEAQQRADAKAERDALQENFLALDARLKALEEVVEYNSSSILNIAGKKYVEPKKKRLVPISEEADRQQFLSERMIVKEGDALPEANGPSSKNLESQESTNNSSKSWWQFW